MNKSDLLTVILGLLMFTLEGINYSIVAPFFPLEAAQKETSKSIIGFVISTYDIAAALTPIVLSNFIDHYNKRFIFLAGTLMGSVAVILFGILCYSPPGAQFYLSAIALRFVSGMGSGMVWSAGYPLLVSVNYAWTNMIIIGWEITIALGIALGPPIGSILYSIDGFPLPFYVIGTTEFIATLLFVFIMPSKTNHNSGKEERPNLKKFLKFFVHPAVLIISFISMCNSAMFAVMDTILSPYLVKTFGIQQNSNGFIFSLMAIGYLAATVFGTGINKGLGTYIFLTGAIFSMFGTLLFILQEWINALANIPIVLTALFFIGLGDCTSGIASYVIVENTALRYKILSLQNIKLICSIWTSCIFSLGRIYGAAVIGGLIYGNFGMFTTFKTSLAMQFGIFLLNVLTFLLSGFFKRIYLTLPDDEVKTAFHKSMVISKSTKEERVHLIKES